MKKLLLYIVTAIIVISCGVSIYYVVRNDENIYSTIAQDEATYLNIGETMDIHVVHERKNSKTELTVSSNSENIEINLEDWTLTAAKPGGALVTVTSSNKKFGPFEFSISVGNGSVQCPYYIRSEEDMAKIGKEGWLLGDNYVLVKDLSFTEAFTPIGSTETPFTGSFEGNSYTISNLLIDKTSADLKQPTGLFAAIGENGKVENLNLKDAKVETESKFAGLIAGRNYGLIGKCQIINSSITNTNDIAKTYTGAVVGLNESKNTYAGVRLCTIEARVSSKYVAGGIVGYNQGGVISNNDVKISSVNLDPIESQKDIAMFGGLAGYSKNAETKTSIIMNNLVEINEILGSERVGGLFGEIYANNTANRGFYSMLMYNANKLLKPVVDKNDSEFTLSSQSENARNFVTNISKEERNQRDTYTKIDGSTWDFTKIWSIKAGVSVNLNYLSEDFDYQTLPITGTVVEISSTATLRQALTQMRTNPTANITYLIKGESEKIEEKDAEGNPILDEEGNPVITVKEKTYSYTLSSTWQPIGTEDAPFNGKIIAEKDATVTVRNISVQNAEYAGLFGFLGRDAVINNVNVTGANLNGTYVGVIAGYNNGAEIKNCRARDLISDQLTVGLNLSGTVVGGLVGFNAGGKIEGSNLRNANIISTKYAGGIAGFSSGKIDGCEALSLQISVDEEKEYNIYLAGIVGKTRGEVANSKVNNLVISINFESDLNTVCMGGIVGFSENAKISNSQVLAFEADAKRYTSRAYAGGVVGYSIKSQISRCAISESRQIKLNTNNTSSIAGGLIAFMDGGKVSQSAVGKVILLSHSSAGLVSFCMGEIKECYSGTGALVQGTYVGGMVVNHYGKISNSYSICQLEGKEIEAGMVTFLWKGSSVENSFTYCNFTGEGEGYAETSSNYKAMKDRFGTITNSFIIGFENQSLAKPGMLDFYKKYIISKDGQKKVEVQIVYLKITGTFNYMSQSTLLGQQARDEFIKLGFDENIWSFSEDEIITSPTLKDVYDLGELAYDLVEEQKKEEPKEETPENPEEGDLNGSENTGSENGNTTEGETPNVTDQPSENSEQVAA